MPEIKVSCPAKINFTLKVLGKRPDGFHNIESIMQTISLYDFLTISVEPSDVTEILLSGNNSEIPYNEKNLVWKAANLFFQSKHFSDKYKINVYIEKHIPVAAGLAGGSTDAAGMLYGLNYLLSEPYTKKELHSLCAQLGSDLNFCLEGGTQMTSGRGEILSGLPFDSKTISLVKPKNLGISAKEAYTKFAEKVSNNSSGRENYVNDLEWAVIDDYPELLAIKAKYPNSVMSGSGSTYYLVDGVFENFDENFVVINNLQTISNGVTIQNPCNT